MSILPDELWTEILTTGTTLGLLTHRDLSSLALTSRRLHRLSNSPALWSTLLALHFPSPPPTPSPSPKALYKTRFQRDKARMVAGWRRQVMESESRVAVCRAKVRELEGLVAGEGERLKAAVRELSGLERARQASVALNVWQPEVVRGRQKQIVEQCTVPIESRLGALRMEVRLCKQQIATYNKAYNDQKRKLSEFEESLTSLKYQPLQSNQSSAAADDCNVRRKKKRRSDYGLVTHDGVKACAGILTLIVVRRYEWNCRSI